MRVLGESSEKEMVATFLQAELASDRFGAAIRDQLAMIGASHALLTQPDLDDPRANDARATMNWPRFATWPVSAPTSWFAWKAICD